MRKQQPERAERLAFMEWMKLRPDIRRFLIAIENGGTRHRLEAYNIKRCGLCAGTPDYFFMRGTSMFHGLWIEFKAGKNKLTAAQKQFFKTATEAGYKCITVWSSKEAITEIDTYLKNKE